ncbi:MAG TPA: methylenetetrahydrofolate--tRNA-(uracil(54)-C(5))-methyltransferase (FADH(2)-oxidizing) TrmFO [Syntrophomonadaceae bacterium]|nr:methylenetetrahydrofolate--tRNA-(uracil(54)-C(5))-methyltransferase (FADH(2)-oxidizing) TrmFO [Syntrophomonadaceae bacterium]
MDSINVVGGGLAGSEAAFFLAQRGIEVRLWEMRPKKMTPVHRTGNMAELVCSNSLKSELPSTAQGLLKHEMKIMGSLLLECAETARVPAGSALAVDRDFFSVLVTRRLENHPRITVINEELIQLPQGEITVVATGPLTSDSLSEVIKEHGGEENLHFYDAVAPSITEESINKDIAFKASRYGKGSDDYYNCPFNREQYEHFYSCLLEADINEGHTIDKKMFFSGCMPIEVMARRGKDTLRFGPMRPVGLEGENGSRAHAVVQLRQEDRDGHIYGLVGFQTRLKWGEQDRIFRLIPGLENAEFVRYGVMHRNTYLNSPRLLLPTLQFHPQPEVIFAGQVTGVEGYMESAATGIFAAINAERLLRGEKPVSLPVESMLGSLVNFVTMADSNNFQPINANFGILPLLPDPPREKKVRYEQYVQRAIQAMTKFSELYITQVVK